MENMRTPGFRDGPGGAPIFLKGKNPLGWEGLGETAKWYYLTRRRGKVISFLGSWRDAFLVHVLVLAYERLLGPWK